MSRKLHIIGNWKMHGSKEQVRQFFAACHEMLISKPVWLKRVQGVICPPVVYLAQASQALDGQVEFKLGAQDVSQHESGAYTGQISATMLKEHHCHYVIVGHSERRQLNHETNEEIAAKFFKAKASGLIPVLCVGETEAERREGATEKVVLGQLRLLLEQYPDAFNGGMIAYEPVWAIGTGVTATPEEAQAVHHLLRSTLGEYDAQIATRIPILYGGSVKPNNAEALFKMPDIDGALVGGASLVPTDFFAICQAAGKLTAGE